MPGYEDCIDCEFRGRAEVCWCLDRGIPHVCETARTRPDYRALIHRETLGIPWRRPKTGRRGRGRVTATPVPVGIDSAPLIYTAVDLCPHRRTCQCGGSWDCDKPGPIGKVTLADCRVCPVAAAILDGLRKERP